MAKRLPNIKELSEFVNSIGFELITKEYNNSNQKLIIKDKEGYRFQTLYRGLKKNPSSKIFDKVNPFTIENIKLWIILNNKSFELISDIYEGSSQKLIFKDQEGYYYNGKLRYMVTGTLSRFEKRNPYTIKNIDTWCKLNNRPFELVSDIYESRDDKLRFKCHADGCGEIFKSSWGEIYNGRGCGYCHGLQVGISNCLDTLNPRLSLEWHIAKNGDLTPYDVTCGNGSKAWWKCVNGHEWDATIASRNKDSKCPYCSHKLPSKEYNLLVVNPIICEEWDYDKNDKSPEEYCPGSNLHVHWICKVCNYEWFSGIFHRNAGDKTGCPACSASKGEKKCKEYFDLNNIHNVPQKEFNGLIGLGSCNLSYDFYLPQYNLLIEYQGEYHDGTARNQTKEQFITQQEHDRRKKEYAINNNIFLLQIWYWDFENIDKVLEGYLMSCISINEVIMGEPVLGPQSL